MFRISTLSFGAACLLAGILLGVGPARAEGSSSPTRETKLSLDDAIRGALEKNFVVKVQSFEPAIARAAVTEALGRFDPLLKGTYGESRNEKPSLADPLTSDRRVSVTKSNDASLAIEGQLPFGTLYQIGGDTRNARGTANGNIDNYSTYGGISVTQPLLRDFGLNPGLVEVRIARTNLAISEWEYRLAVTNVVTQVIYAYSDLHLAQARLRSALRSREMATQLFNENEGRRQRGAMSEYDVLSARARVAKSEEGVLNATRGVSVAENALKQLVSDDRDPEFYTWRVTIEPLPAAITVSLDAASAFQEALTQRPDYRRAKLNARRGELIHRFERNQLLPRVDVSGSYGYNGIGGDFDASRRDARSEDYAAYSTSVSVCVPLTSATERGRARAASLRRRQAESDVERLEQDILVSVGNIVQQVETTRLRVASTQTARELNEQMLQAELKRLRAGTGSTFNVLYQQEQLSSAEIAEAQARADHRKAVAEYDRQVGRTLETHGIVLRSDENRSLASSPQPST